MNSLSKQTVDLQAYNSVVEVIEESFARYADKPMFSCMGKTLSYADIDRLSGQFASYLQQHTSLAPGDRIAVQLPNLIQYAVAVYGALRVGLVVVNTNPMYTPREMLHQFNDAEVKAIVVLADLLPALEQVLPDTSIERVIITGATDMVDPQPLPETGLSCSVSLLDALRLGEQSAFEPVAVQREDIALLQYTGGTTGVSKGAILTHANLVANLLQGKAALFEKFTAGNETYVVPLPLYHIYAFAISLLMLPKDGQLIVLIPDPRNLDAFVAELKRHRFSGFAGLNTLFVGLCHHAGFKALDFSHLKVTHSGGMALNQDTFDLWQSVTHCPPQEGYGLTETSPLATINPSDGIQVGTVGKPCIATELKVIDDSGSELPHGEPGELCIRGPQVMRGYWQRPEATAEVISEDGWLRTGDIAIIQPDGYVKIVDRMKDMVIVSGFNVFPNEIEDVVMLCPGILECAVVGVDDEKSGEAVKLFVVAEDPELSADSIKQFCRNHLTAYKVPKHIEFRDELPKSNVGKILRRELR